MDAGPSRSPVLTPRQREKAPVSPDAVALPPAADHEITLLIADYLETRHPRLAELLAGEVGARDEAARDEIDAVERAILDGDFASIESILTPGLLSLQTQKAFLYLCYRQQFLEYIDNRESQKAFNLLQKRLKPLEHYQPVPYDFYSLSYLTSASTVHDAPGLRDWAGAGPERERLVTTWRELTEGRRAGSGTSGLAAGLTSGLDTSMAAGALASPSPPVPHDRLITLLRQAAAWQVTAVQPRSSGGPFTLNSLLADYTRPAVPSRLERLVRGHRANVKCVDFLGDGLGISGSSDATLRIFGIDDGTTRRVLTGHQSRVWDVSVSETASRLVASASGDGTVRIWTPDDGECTSVLAGDGVDVYSVQWQPGRDDRVVSACYDKILRLWDVESGKLLRTFSGHAQSTLAVTFDPTGRVIASGSKDKHIRLWDAVGGVCVQTMTAHLGEVTSVQFDHEGKYLLAGCKDNSNRLWDLRMQRNIYRYTGHQNTSKNIIRCAFASPSSSLIAGGSEDGLVYLWEREGSGSQDNMRALSAASVSASVNGSGTSTPASSSAFSPNLAPLTAARAPPPLPTIATVPRGPSGPSGPGLAPTHHSLSSATTAATAANSAAARVSAAYYPAQPRAASATNGPGLHSTHGTLCTTIRPLRALAGHGAGAVFDVRGSKGTLLSAGEDGAVGVWGDDE